MICKAKKIFTHNFHNIQNMSEFRVSNMVIVAQLDRSFTSLDDVFQCLTLLPINFQVGTKTGSADRQSVPFFGYNGVIIGLKYKKESRGILRPKGHLPNLIGMDLQCYDKNVNIKISESNLHLTGVKNMEMAYGICHILQQHFEMCASHLEHLKSLTIAEFQACIEWIVGNFIIVSLDDYGEYVYNIKDYNTCLSLLSQIPSTVDSRAVTYMAMFVSDYDSFVGYYHKILLLRDRNPFVGGIPSVTNIRIANGLYVYKLPGGRICMSSAADAINSIVDSQGRKKYQVSFHNWQAGKKLSIIRPTNGMIESITGISIKQDEEDSESQEIETQDASFHRFVVYQTGSVRQYSPTSFVEAQGIYEDLLKDFQLFNQNFEANIAVAPHVPPLVLNIAQPMNVQQINFIGMPMKIAISS